MGTLPGHKPIVILPFILRVYTIASGSPPVNEWAADGKPHKWGYERSVSPLPRLPEGRAAPLRGLAAHSPVL